MTSAEMTRDNLRGGLLMVAAMAAFAVEDMMVKIVAGTIPAGQIILAIGLGSTLVLTVIALRQRHPLITPAVLHPLVILRNLAEMSGTAGFITALTLMPLGTASALHQTMPLAMTLGAAVFLGEKVGWRRWMAVALGFAGVLVILRPTGDGLSATAAAASMTAVFSLAVRDLATRKVVGAVSSLSLALWGSASFIPTGLILMTVSGATWVMPLGVDWLLLAGVAGMGVTGYWLMVVATRVGEVSAIMPYRYSRLVFAMILGFLAFRETPDALMLVGSAMIVGSGLYTFLRERYHAFHK
ncbi:EamA-like transporter family protein [Gemmobacter megaterium]|uniref:EamA-like transporter family protein n=1 Tax=Gemmobacter megaterium TaxID=1086013 RepID=A0A1N7PC19_9RHOB|nr:DMT family transporter [Gemmobacter megaterium]GGE19178.1 membrane protein [Gemmobacter megaterium]SIT08131.1 EamA-like transporter family protein [Gemmobacter megaterium]